MASHPGELREEGKGGGNDKKKKRYNTVVKKCVKWDDSDVTLISPWNIGESEFTCGVVNILLEISYP